MARTYWSLRGRQFRFPVGQVQREVRAKYEEPAPSQPHMSWAFPVPARPQA